MPALKTRQQFIEDARKVHGDKYDYELIEYVGSTQHVNILCRRHGVFRQTPFKHLQGQGCRQCPKPTSLVRDGFVKRAREMHGEKYSYEQADYKGTGYPVTVTCKQHGSFTLQAGDLFRGTGCKKCYDEGRILTMEQWLEAAARRHGDRYDYSQVVYVKSDQPVTIQCTTHGGFRQISNSHLQGAGCPRCSKRVSKPATEWLAAMAVLDGTHIQHGENGGEVRIAGTRWHADGYSAELNKVYEFHGDYYHGNPRRYPADQANKTCKRTMGELYDKTCKRRKVVEDLGYAYEELWEDELEAAKTLLTLAEARA